VTADQEFYLLQAASLMLGPANFVLAVMDRWFCRDISPATARYMMDFEDPQGTVTDFEDLLWFLIHLSTDTDRPMQRPIEFTATREIIQLLAIKPMTFGEISKRLSDRMVERVEISKIVRLVAHFRGPTETAPGMYTLKPKFLPDIDPFWRHYSRNERKEVLDRLLQKTFEERSDRSIKFDDWFYIPNKPKLPAEPTPFWNLNGILRSPIAVYVLQVVIEHCVLMEDDKQFLELTIPQENRKVELADIPRFDQLLEIALHFATLALRAEPDDFVQNALSFNGNPVEQMALPTAFSRQVSLYQNLWYIETSNIPVYKPYRSRVQYLTRHIRQTFSDEVREEHEQITALKQNPNQDLVPAAASQMTAAERQKQVMAEFAKKQAAFAANMSFGDDGEEDDAIDMEDDGDDSNESQGPCIVCQDPVTPTQPGGMLAMFQPSRIIRETLVDDPVYAEQSLHIPSNFDCATRKLTYTRNLRERHCNSQIHDSHPAHSMKLGCYISVCGHYMHESCMEQYSDHTRIRHSHQLHRNQPENVVRYEYMCPLCKSVSNFILPIDFTATPVGTKKSFRVNEEDGRPLTLLEHVRRMSAEGLKHINDSTKIWQHHTEGGHVKAWFSDFAIPRTAKDTREGDMRGTCHMVDRYRHLVRSLEEQSVALRKVTKKPFYVPEDAVGYTIAVLEIAQRGLARAPGQATVAEQLLDSSRKVIKKLFEELKLELDGVYGKPYNQAGLRVAIFARFLPDWFRASSLPTSLLLRDPLSIVIECAAIAPDVLHAVIIMAYYAELSRALIAASIILRKHLHTWKEWPIAADPFEYDAGPYAEQARARFANFSETAIGMFRNATPYNDVEHVLKIVPDALLSKMLYMYTLPFVRRAAIIFYSVHGCYPVSKPEDIITEGCEYDRLGSLLALPDPRVTLADKATGIEGTMVLRWLSQWAAGGRQMAATEVPEIYELKFLPKHLDQLILRYGDDECMKCARAPSFPGLCLFCGELICIGGDCCADEELGECNLHMQM
jgi:E3 ubiquitin-protein ligase UBR1